MELFKGPNHKARRLRYLITCGIANATIGSLVALAALLLPPRYISEWSLIVPSSDMDAKISLDSVGEASSASRSTYDAKSLDPRVNYRSILLSDTVLGTAARSLKMSIQEFGKPQVKLVEQSSVIELRSISSTASSAQKKALALRTAFQAKLDELRKDEASLRERSIDAAIQTARSKLDDAQRKLLEFKVGANVVSTHQLEDAVTHVANLRQRSGQLRSDIAKGQEYIRRLATSLHFSPELAGRVMTLRADASFMQYFQKLVSTRSELNEFEAKWGNNHPQVVAAQNRLDVAITGVLARARSLLGKDVDSNQLERLAIALGDSTQEPLLRELVSIYAQTNAQIAESATIEAQLSELEGEKNRLAQEYSTLDDLERRLKFAEAVFNSTLGKIDVGRSNIFSSYPLIQAMEQPNLPEKRDKQGLLFILLGAVSGCVLINIALTLAWLRQKQGALT